VPMKVVNFIVTRLPKFNAFQINFKLNRAEVIELQIESLIETEPAELGKS